MQPNPSHQMSDPIQPMTAVIDTVSVSKRCDSWKTVLYYIILVISIFRYSIAYHIINLLSYPLHSHHCSDGVCWRGGGASLPAALREAQICRYLVYSEADFEVFRPAGATRCTDGGEIPLLHAKFHANR